MKAIEMTIKITTDFFFHFNMFILPDNFMQNVYRRKLSKMPSCRIIVAFETCTSNSSTSTQSINKVYLKNCVLERKVLVYHDQAGIQVDQVLLLPTKLRQ